MKYEHIKFLVEAMRKQVDGIGYYWLNSGNVLVRQTGVVRSVGGLKGCVTVVIINTKKVHLIELHGLSRSDQRLSGMDHKI